MLKKFMLDILYGKLYNMEELNFYRYTHMTDLEFQAWLVDDTAMRVILVDVDVLVSGSEITRYISTKGYNLPDASILYNPIITGGVEVNESVDLSGRASLSYGDLELDNCNGEYDSWLDDVWNGRNITVYLGDVRWPKSDFRIIFNGITDSITTRSRDKLNLRLRDKLERLNSAITDAKLDNYWHGSIVPIGTYENANRDTLKPLIFGEVHNVEPLLIDPTELEYMLADGAIESIIEIRDNGVPIPSSIIPNLAAGKFKLAYPNAGTITASVQGFKKSTDTLGAPDAVYTNNIAKIIQVIATQYGKSSTRFTASDIDLANFNAFATAHPQPVGLIVDDKSNALQVMQELASSIGAHVTMNREGKLHLVQLDPPTSASFTINPDDMFKDSFQINEVMDVAASVKLAYAKNWTVQNDLLTGIPIEHKDLYAKEWLTIVSTDSATITDYKLDTEPEEEETLLLSEVDANDEADRRLNIRTVRRRVYGFDGKTRLMQLQVGQPVFLVHPRFGLENGKYGQIISLRPNYINMTVQVEVLV
jgi:hypothetical protein